jgi:hypothetical protein
MNAICKSAWTIMILGAAVGCAGEDEPAAPAAAPAGPAPSVKPAAPSAPAPTKSDEAPKVEGPKAENSKSGAGATKLTADELAAIKELPASEQDVATRQAVCPVSSHHLGSMGMPVKVSALGRTFYLCCDDCNEKVKADPKAYVAKLDKLGAGK